MLCRWLGWTFLLTTLAASAVPAADPPSTVRAAGLAGVWYPADPGDLARRVDRLLEETAGPASGDGPPVRALVAPHAAYRWSGGAAAAAFRQVRGECPRRVVVLGPSHWHGFSGLALARETAFETPLGQVPVDVGAVAALAADPFAAGDPTAHTREHAIEVQLPFLQRALAPGWQLVPLLVGKLEAGEERQAADLLRPLLGEDTLLVVSGDFTHYGARFGFLPFPPDADAPARLEALDMGAFDPLRNRDPDGLRAYGERTGITACALDPLRILASLLPAQARVERVAYYRSGDLTGDFRSSVSYLAATVRAAGPLGGTAASGGLSETELRYLHAIATTAVEGAVAPGNGAQGRLEGLLAGLPGELSVPAGAFVTLRRGGELRGCVGTVQPSGPVAHSVAAQAVQASLNDPRFPPVRPEELAGLDVEVSILSPLRPIGSWQQFEPGRHGVVLRRDGRRALFLPRVPVDQGWGREETLSHLAQKAGLVADAWRDGAELAVFTAQHYPER
jgi:hypothetical protein